MEQTETTQQGYAAIVLRNTKNAVSAVRFMPVTDALLSGGVLLGEITLLSYENPEAVVAALTRLSQSYDGVFIVCDKVLVTIARDAVARLTGKPFASDYLSETKEGLFAVLPADEKGVDIARAALIPAVERRRGDKCYSVVIRTVSAPAELVLSAISGALEEADESVSIHTGGGFGCERIEIVYNQKTPKLVMDAVVRVLANELKEYIYAMEDVGIAERLCDVLKLHKLRLSTAESFTGGGVGKAIVDIPGASKIYYEGINAYDNWSKMRRLGVNEYTLNSKGAVSHETAYEMAAGLLKEGHCDVAIATTGIAGPSSDGTGKPVGLFYIAVGSSDRVRVFEYRLDGSREEITQTAINLALFLTLKEISR